MLSLICTGMSVHSSALSFFKKKLFFNLICAENTKQLLEVSCPNHHPLRAQSLSGDPEHTLSMNPVDIPFVLDTMLLFNQFSTPCSLCSLNPA